ncbi:hypothetical protein I7I51_00108, partial [Histoplasma capsulatum]
MSPSYSVVAGGIFGAPRSRTCCVPAVVLRTYFSGINSYRELYLTLSYAFGVQRRGSTVFLHQSRWTSLKLIQDAVDWNLLPVTNQQERCNMPCPMFYTD